MEVEGLKILNLLEKKIYTTEQATVEFTKLDSTYDHYFIEFNRLWPSVNGDELYLYVYADGAWQAATDYAVNSAASASQIEIATDMKINGGTGYGGGRGRVDVYMYDASTASHAAIDAEIKFGSTTTILDSQSTAAVYLTTEAISGIRFKTSTGNIEGEFRLYGVIK